VGNAVFRNYCKRIVRVYIRNHRKHFRKFNYIIFIYTYPGSVTYKELATELNQCLEKNIEKME